MDKTLAEEIRAILHQAIIQPAYHSYREIAEATRAGLARQTKEGDWNVIVARGVYQNARRRNKAYALFRVPCLLGDLPSSCIPRDEHIFSAIIFKTSGDPEYVSPKYDILTNKLLTNGKNVSDGTTGKDIVSSSASSASSSVIPTTTTDDIVHQTNQILDANTNTLIADQGTSNVLTTPESISTALTAIEYTLAPPLPGTHVVRSTIACKESLDTILNCIGGAQRTIGLNDATEGIFTTSLKTTLTNLYGSTWHIFLGRTDDPPPSLKSVAVNSGKLYDSGSSKLKEEKEKIDKESFLEYQKRLETHGTTAIDPTAHLPHFGVVASRGGYIEVWCAPHYKEGKKKVSEEIKKKTPERYHICAFRTVPGEGEGSNASWFTSDSTGEGTIFSNKTKLLRTICFAAAFSCLLVYGIFIFGTDNRCSRMISYGVHQGNLANNALMERTIDQLNPDGTIGGNNHSSSSILPSSSSLTGSVAAQFGLGPLPPLPVSELTNQTATSSSSSYTNIILFWIVEPLKHIINAFGLSFGPSITNTDGTVTSSFDAALDSMLPVLPPERSVGSTVSSGSISTPSVTDEFGNIIESPSSSSSSFSDSIDPTLYFSPSNYNLPEYCTRQATIIADRRVLRSRSLIYAAVAFLALASLVRILGQTIRQSTLRGLLKSMSNVPAARKGTTASTTTAGGTTTKPAGQKKKD